MAYTPPGRTRRRVYRFVRRRLLGGNPPSIREVQRALGFRSVESARSQLEALVAEGLLLKRPGRARGYALPGGEGAPRPTLRVPVLGRVQAGDLSLAVQDPEGWLELPARRRLGELFALRVRGESMTGAGILPGDLVLVRRQPSADPGDIVVALVEDEATVKTLRRRRGRWVLQPENPAFEPILPAPDELTLLGKVVEVHRHLEGRPLLDPAS
jgi:repressor LexA